MDPNEVVKVVAEVAKAAAPAAGLSIPFTGIVKRMLGPAADELAEMWRDQVRLYRYERQLKCVEKAERMARDAGFTPQEVPPKILFPLLEGASFEEDENLHDMWAALLANASSPLSAQIVRPGFVEILKNMAPDEARLLKWIKTFYEERVLTDPEGERGLSLLIFGNKMGSLEIAGTIPPETEVEEHHRYAICLGGLIATQLVDKIYWEPQSDVDLASAYAPRSELRYTITLTVRGLSFIRACQPPKPKS